VQKGNKNEGRTRKGRGKKRRVTFRWIGFQREITGDPGVRIGMEGEPPEKRSGQEMAKSREQIFLRKVESVTVKEKGRGKGGFGSSEGGKAQLKPYSPFSSRMKRERILGN